MIFLTIGTHEPFDRLVQAMDAWCDGQVTAGRPLPEIVAQIIPPASGAHVPRHFTTIARLDPGAYDACFRRAALIVSHAGMGSILTACTLGKPIVIMPRRGHLRETRNDHQFDTAGQLGRRPGIFLAGDETAFAATMDRALAAIGTAVLPPASPVAPAAFTDALRLRILERPRKRGSHLA